MKRSLVIFLLGLTLAGCSVNPAERNNTGNQLVQNGEYEAALDAYQAALIAEPDNPVFYFNTANAYDRLDAIEEAITALEQSIARTDDEAFISAAYYNLGNIYLSIGEWEAAIEAYQETLRRNPENDDARYNLEYAWTGIIQPTPTSQEQQTELQQEQVNPTEPPTPNPAGQELPTATPPPEQDGPPPPSGPTPIGQEGDSTGVPNEDNEGTAVPNEEEADTVGTEEAEELLEEVENAQDTIGTFRDNYEPLGTPNPERDW